jgi:HEAT repeat protein
MRGFWEALRRNIEKQRTESAWRAELRPPERITSMLRSADATTLLRLDREFRQGHNPYLGDYGYIWDTMPPGQLIHVPHFASDAAICGLFSFHRNGYVRQAAVEALAGIQNGSEIEYLLLRLEDWVEQVRSRAAAALRARVVPELAWRLLDNLPLLLRLTDRPRANSQRLISEAIRIVATLATPKQMDRGLRHSDTRVRAWWIEIVLSNATTTGREERVWVVERLLEHKDAALRTMAARAARYSGDVESSKDLLRQIIGDKAARVRLEGVYALEAMDRPDSALVRDLLLDNSVQIRREAAARVAPRCSVDLRKAYLLALESSNSRHVAIALRSLASFDNRADVAAVRRFWDDPRPRVQRAAILAVSALDAGLSPLALVEKLRSHMSGVSREASDALVTRIHRDSASLFWLVAVTTSIPHVHRNTLRLLALTGKWTSIRYIVMALRRPELQEQARDLYSAWWSQYNKVFTPPATAELDCLEEAINEHAGDLRETLLKDFEPILREWRERIGA